MFKEEEWELLREISSAVYRVSALVKEPSLKKELVSAAVEIISRNDAENETLPRVSSIDRLARVISLGRTIGEISQINSTVLEREIALIRQRVREAVKSPSSFILSSFHKSEESVSGPSATETAEVRKSGNVQAEIADRKSGNLETASGNLLPAGNTQVLAMAGRQRKIMEYVRQFPDGCRAKDIYMRFPDVSDRTLRNDIRTLVESMRLEKFGGETGQERVRLLPLPVSGNVLKEGNGSNAPVVTN